MECINKLRVKIVLRRMVMISVDDPKESKELHVLKIKKLYFYSYEWKTQKLKLFLNQLFLVFTVKQN